MARESIHTRVDSTLKDKLFRFYPHRGELGGVIERVLKRLVFYLERGKPVDVDKIAESIAKEDFRRAVVERDTE